MLEKNKTKKKHVLETEVPSALRALQFAGLEPEGGFHRKAGA